jgi:hypothetical protein
MRLTNEMREDFADRVMKKIPVRSNWTREKIIDEIEKRLLATWPKEVQDFRKKYPGQINNTTMRFNWLDYKDDDTYRYGRAACIFGTDQTKVNLDDLKEHYRELCNEQQERKEMRARIVDQARACNTLAQLEVVFPDLKGLMPKPVVAVKSLPVAAKGLTDDLVKLGLEIPQ